MHFVYTQSISIPIAFKRQDSSSLVVRCRVLREPDDDLGLNLMTRGTLKGVNAMLLFWRSSLILSLRMSSIIRVAGSMSSVMNIPDCASFFGAALCTYSGRFLSPPGYGVHGS